MEPTAAQSAAVFVIAMVPLLAAAQQFLPNFGPAVDPNTRFEVVAIKAVNDAGGQVLMRTTPGRFEATVPVGLLLRQALQKPDYQIVGAPAEGPVPAGNASRDPRAGDLPSRHGA